MAHSRNIQPSTSHPYAQPSRDDTSTSSRSREPLVPSYSAGNATSIGLYHESKGAQPRATNMPWMMPTVPSQPRQPIGSTLDLRRQSTRRRRHLRCSRNPIVDSPQYQAYRNRQNREGNPEDAIKWPEMLEHAFLDALLEIPPMGRRKFSYRGKPHGRNELIKEYLWIAYTQSLPPVAHPDETMKRTRKQVSSHIQVLKGFLQGHPAFDRLFPENKKARNGFEDSFKDDPCLIALSEGRLPSKRYDQYDNLNQPIMNNHAPTKPVLFWLLITSEKAPEDSGGRCTEQDLCNEGIVAHKFTGLSAQRNRDSLESIANWRQRFPYLEQIQARGELNCDIIHMDASLNLLSGHPPDGSELCSRTDLSIPGRQSRACEWRLVTTLSKPPDLYRDPITDPPLEAEISGIEILSMSDDETRIKIPFPANAWAQTFVCLYMLQGKYDEKMKAQSLGMDSGPPAKSSREYVDQISMYQEVQSSAGPRMPFTRRAILVWTFHKTREGEGNGTNWRYLDNLPPRRLCMSPSPHPSHHVSAAMNENFNSWSDTPLHLQHPNMLDPFGPGLVTPPHTAGLQSPFTALGSNYFSQGFDLPIDENISFASSTTCTVDSESTLVDDTASNIDHFLSNTNVHLADYDHNGTTWQLPPTESFDADPAWANYNVVASTPAIGWDTSDAKNHSWNEGPDTKQLHWDPQDDTPIKHDWTVPEVGSSSSKGRTGYIEQSIEQKLLPWIDEHNEINETQKEYTNITMEKVEDGPAAGAGLGISTKASQEHDWVTVDHGSAVIDAVSEAKQEHDWVAVEDGFDYAELAERLK